MPASPPSGGHAFIHFGSAWVASWMQANVQPKDPCCPYVVEGVTPAEAVQMTMPLSMPAGGIKREHKMHHVLSRLRLRPIALHALPDEMQVHGSHIDAYL